MRMEKRLPHRETEVNRGQAASEKGEVMQVSDLSVPTTSVPGKHPPSQ